MTNAERELLVAVARVIQARIGLGSDADFLRDQLDRAISDVHDEQERFGFTQADVDALREAYVPMGQHADYDFEALADRIAALLPPPPQHGDDQV